MNSEEAFARLIKYCTYQERCHEEVRAKLLSLKVYGNELEEVMNRLIQNNFLNEERFAKTYAGSKFRQMQWGRTKIIHQLKFRKISEYCIQEAMKEINDEDYLQTFRSQLEKRRRQLKEDKNIIHKTAQYLISKGYEPELVWKEVKGD